MKGYIWRKEWAWPYESAWGILEKFKYANALDNQVFKGLLKLKKSSVTRFSSELFIYEDAIVDNELLYSNFGIPRSHFSCLDIFLGNKPNAVFREDLYYCPRCMELGYHSFLHQIKMISRCPFHDDELKKASYKKKTIKYSLSSLQKGAFSSMKHKATTPADKFTQILASRMLIDGPWDNACQKMTFTKISLDRLIFYTPFFDIRGSMKLPQDSTYNLMYKLLTNESTNTTPVVKISLKECGENLSGIIEQAKRWFESREMHYNHHQLNSCFTISLISSLIEPYGSKEIDDTIFKLLDMRHMQIERVSITDRFVEVASALLTGYNVSNSRYIGEAIDYSLIYHPSTHNIYRCNFPLYNMEQFTSPESRIHKYIHYLIYSRLFYLLRSHIKHLLTQPKGSIFDYQDRIDFHIPDYVITLKNSIYEIYEFKDD